MIRESIYEFTALDIRGVQVDLACYRHQVLLIVNVASQCKFTPQYAELEALQQAYRSKGFSVLGFPCNQFGNQEPGSNQDVQSFCDVAYGVSFPLFTKIHVNGPDAHPLFQWLTRQAPGIWRTQRIKWNFTKFLVDRSGQAVQRYAPMTNPRTLRPAIERFLSADP